jgi:hypothetical protein
MMATKRKLETETMFLPLYKKPCTWEINDVNSAMQEFFMEIKKKDLVILQLSTEMERKDLVIIKSKEEIKKRDTVIIQLASQRCNVFQEVMNRTRDPCSYIN